MWTTGFKYNLSTSALGNFRFGLDVTHVMTLYVDRGRHHGAGSPAPTATSTATTPSGGAARPGCSGAGRESMCWPPSSSSTRSMIPGRLLRTSSGPRRDPSIKGTLDLVLELLGRLHVWPDRDSHPGGYQQRVQPRGHLCSIRDNVENANTDVSTYDTVGRRWFVSLTQKF